MILDRFLDRANFRPLPRGKDEKIGGARTESGDQVFRGHVSDIRIGDDGDSAVGMPVSEKPGDVSFQSTPDDNRVGLIDQTHQLNTKLRIFHGFKCTWQSSESPARSTS